MKKEVLLVLLDEYSDWESAFLAGGLRAGGRYVPRVVGPTREAVVSMGGFRTLPDYDLETLPKDYAAVVLIGGTGWQSKEAERVVELVRSARERGKVVGGICNGASFLAAHGFLNDVRHTGNTLERLDGGMVTANGTGYLEFARELLLLLEADEPERIEADYTFQKRGLYTA